MIERAVRNRALAIVSLIVAFGATRAGAGPTTYSDYTSWLSANPGGVSINTIPDPGAGQFTFLGSGTASLEYGGVTFSTSVSLSNGNFFVVGPDYESTGNPTPVLSSSEQTTGTPNILISLPGPTSALAFFYGTFLGDDVTFTLSNGDSVTLGSTGSGYFVPNFFGVQDSTPFTSVLVTTVANPNEVLNIGSVPEPASLTLLCGLLTGIGTIVYRRRRRGPVPLLVE